MAKDTESKELVVKEEVVGAVATFDFGEHAGGGFEGISAGDLMVPWLNLLQSNSPPVEEGEPEGAKAGMLYNSVTKQLWPGDEGVIFVPCHNDKAWVEWVPIDNGGGLVAQHDPNGEIVRIARAETALLMEEDGKFRPKPILENGNELVETAYFYGLLLDGVGKKSIGFAVISFSSTKLKPCGIWTTAMYTLMVDTPDGKRVRPPMWANRARLRTVKQKNDFGTFYTYRIDPAFGGDWAGSIIHPGEEQGLWKDTLDFREMVQSGMAKADFSKERAMSGAEGDPAQSGVGKAPF